ncbi:MAG: lipopolysaccharide biosynthesis protein [Opitutales bacterium]|nr:lipopolysaccharide biosynthesis protein [Opitutales bacterium]
MSSQDQIDIFPDAKRGLSRSILSGAAWNLFNLFFSKGVSYIALLILARILVPDDFGLVAIALIFTGLFTVIGDLGLTGAIIQRREEQLDRVHLDTAFWASAAFNLVLLVLFAGLIGPLVSWFYDREILHAIVAVSALQMSISTFSVVPKAILTRNLAFRTLVIAESSAAIVAAIAAITFALNGYGAWSLVFQTLIQAIVLCLLLWLNLRWFPQFRFSKEALRDLLGFGIYDALVRIVIYFSKNVDYLMVGKFLGPQALGAYSIAFLMTDLLRSQIMAVLNRVMFPIYGRLQDHPTEIRRHYLLVVRYNTLAVTPVMILFFFMAEEIIQIFLGNEWSEAIVPLKAMAVASVIHSIGGTTGAVFRGMGKTSLHFYIYTFKTLFVTIPLYATGILLFGLIGAALSMVFSKIIARFIGQWYLKRLISVSEKDIISSLKPAFYSSLSSLPAVTFILFFPFKPTALVFTAIALSIFVPYSVTAFIVNKRCQIIY